MTEEIAIKITSLMGQAQRNSLVKRTIDDWFFYFELMGIENQVEEFNRIMQARIENHCISICSPIKRQGRDG